MRFGRFCIILEKYKICEYKLLDSYFYLEQTTATTSIMIPGKNICYSGWTREYYGYLASGANYQAAASSYASRELELQSFV
jgi:hypothetical protein